MPYRLRNIVATVKEYGVDYDPRAGKGSHGALRRDGHRRYTIPADKGLNTEVGDTYIKRMCEQLGLDHDEVLAKLR